jgi:hypothetical protein
MPGDALEDCIKGIVFGPLRLNLDILERVIGVVNEFSTWVVCGSNLECGDRIATKMHKRDKRDSAAFSLVSLFL